MGIAIGVLLLSFTQASGGSTLGSGGHSPPSPNRSQALPKTTAVIFTSTARIITVYHCSITLSLPLSEISLVFKKFTLLPSALQLNKFQIH